MHKVKYLALLAKERKAIIDADFQTISEITAEKVALFTGIEDFNMNADDIRHVSLVLQENQVLLQSSISGIKSARNRLQEIQNVRCNLGIYGNDGLRSDLCMSGPELEKKA